MTPEEHAHHLADALSEQQYFEDYDESRQMLIDAFRAAIAEEREACAQVADSVPMDLAMAGFFVPANQEAIAEEIARKIRARGEAD
jgi:hypothetical protein